MTNGKYLLTWRIQNKPQAYVLYLLYSALWWQTLVFSTHAHPLLQYVRDNLHIWLSLPDLTCLVAKAETVCTHQLDELRPVVECVARRVCSQHWVGAETIMWVFPVSLHACQSQLCFVWLGFSVKMNVSDFHSIFVLLFHTPLPFGRRVSHTPNILRSQSKWSLWLEIVTWHSGTWL